VLKRISDMRSLLRGAESAARGFALTGDEGFANEYRDLSTTLRAAFDELVAAVEHNEGERRLLEEARADLVRGIDTGRELIRRRAAGDSAGAAALTQNGESRSAMETSARPSRRSLPKSAGSSRPAPRHRSPTDASCWRSTSSAWC